MNNKMEEIKKTVFETLPKEAQATKVEFEGPEIVIYTANPTAFFEKENIIGKTATELKKKIKVRTDKNLLMEPEKAKQVIQDIVPKEAEIANIQFSSYFSEAVIEALKPGLIIGKEGQTLKKIVTQTGWALDIIRTPTSPSKILQGIRHHLQKHTKERKHFLKKTAEKIYREIPENSNEWFRLSFLGSFREVGRSCILAETSNTKILLDCGVNVANNKDPYPYLDALHFPLNELDAVIISHAHLDHHGFLPYLFKSGYRGPVYCTLPTRDLMALLQFDYIDVLTKEGKEPPYTERDVKECLKHVITREYKETTDIAPDMRITFHNASHVLGSASVHLHVGKGGHNLVYTADIKYGFTRLFNNLDQSFPRIESLIIESTYGGKNDIQPNRIVSETELLKVINETISNQGSVLIPVFAVGRAQEIMLVLENAYRRKKLNAHCYIDGMSQEGSAIHTAYPEFLRENVRRRILQNDSPFTSEIFKIADYQDRDKIIEKGKSIIIASSGMLTGGASLDYFKKMAEDPKNTIIFVGFQSEGSLGRKIQMGAREVPITIENGKTKGLKINMRVETVEGFSGHSDKNQLASYIQRLKNKPKTVIVNHGESSKAISFSKYLKQRFKLRATAPNNLDAIRLM